MPPMAVNKSKTKPGQEKDKESDSPIMDTATCPNTHKNSASTLIEEQQEIKDSLDGHKYLEWLSLLCPPGELTTHQLLATCLHQVSIISRVQKPVINAIHRIAFLLGDKHQVLSNSSFRLSISVGCIPST